MKLSLGLFVRLKYSRHPNPECKHQNQEGLLLKANVRRGQSINLVGSFHVPFNLQAGRDYPGPLLGGIRYPRLPLKYNNPSPFRCHDNERS
ncbi:hypothetical protein CDAR_110911 [Caerostris darwini]|uniref:Uncharacterized protein n=1 Tax=Caerostris darwini TaxID=1538125 RepID=A0AAV4QPP9_9ARAC|nr:hypothetical protein CDAR_110911 [Caerostris darwini]